MDFIAKLPQEISQHVLSYLPPKDLKNCFFVSKLWYNQANTDTVWKMHCMINHIDIEVENKILNSKKSLCKWGNIYRYFIRNVNKWDNDCVDTYDITLKSNHFVLGFGELTILVYYYKPPSGKNEQLHIFRLTEENLKCEQIMDPDLPGTGMVQLLTNDSYTFVCRDNTVLCYKHFFGKYVTYVALCLGGGVLQHATKDFMLFINANCRVECMDTDLTLRHICDDYLWVEDSRNHVHIFNMNTFVSKQIESFQEMKLMCNLVLMWTNSRVMVHYPNGEFIQGIDVEFGYEMFCNKNYILLAIDTYMLGNPRILQTFDINTGKLLLEHSVMRFTDVTLHKTDDSVFVLERSSRDLYRVTSFCGRTGVDLWAVELPNMFYTLWPVTIDIVTYKHLFIWPSNYRRNRYSIFNCISGRTIVGNHGSHKLVNGDVKHVNESCCVSVNSNIVHVRSFL